MSIKPTMSMAANKEHYMQLMTEWQSDRIAHLEAELLRAKEAAWIPDNVMNALVRLDNSYYRSIKREADSGETLGYTCGNISMRDLYACIEHIRLLSKLNVAAPSGGEDGK